MGTAAAISLAQWLNVGVNIALPAVVALVTARLAHPGLKAVVLLFLSAVSGFLTSWLDAENGAHLFVPSQVAFTVLTGFAVAVLAHFGLLSPLAITGSNGAIQSNVPGGLGASSSEVV